MRAATNTINTIVAALTLCAGAMEGREKTEYSPTYKPTYKPTYLPTYQPSPPTYMPTQGFWFGGIFTPGVTTEHVKVLLKFQGATLAAVTANQDVVVTALAHYLGITINAAAVADVAVAGSGRRRLDDVEMTVFITTANAPGIVEKLLQPSDPSAFNQELDEEIAKQDAETQEELKDLDATVADAVETDENGENVVDDPSRPFKDTWFQAIDPLECDGLSPLQVERPDGANWYSLVEHLAGNMTGFREVFRIPGVEPANEGGAPLNGFAMYHQRPDDREYVNNAAMIAVRTGPGVGVAQLCSFDKTSLKCYPELLQLNTLATAAAIVGDTYFYAAGAMLSGQTNVIYAVHKIASHAPDFSSTLDDSLHINNQFSMFRLPNNHAGLFDFTELVEEDGADDLVGDGFEGGIYLVGVGTRYWHPAATYQFPQGGVEVATFVGRVDKDTMELAAYAVLNQELDASSRREGDPIPDNEFSHFGAAYTVRNYEGPDGATVPPRLYFSANSQHADTNPAKWWGRFRLGLDFKIPPACWNAGSEVSDDKECTYANFPSEALPLTKLTWAGSSDKTNRNDGSNCQYLRDPTSAPSVAPSSSPTVVPTGRPSPEPTASTTTAVPTVQPTDFPTTESPTETPTTAMPTRTLAPTHKPTEFPTLFPTQFQGNVCDTFSQNDCAVEYMHVATSDGHGSFDHLPYCACVQPEDCTSSTCRDSFKQCRELYLLGLCIPMGWAIGAGAAVAAITAAFGGLVVVGTSAIILSEILPPSAETCTPGVNCPAFPTHPPSMQPTEYALGLVKSVSAYTGSCLDSARMTFVDGRTDFFAGDGGGGPRTAGYLNPRTEFVGSIHQYQAPGGDWPKCQYMKAGIDFVIHSIETGEEVNHFQYYGENKQSHSTQDAVFQVYWPCQIVGFDTAEESIGTSDDDCGWFFCDDGEEHEHMAQAITSVWTDCGGQVTKTSLMPASASASVPRNFFSANSPKNASRRLLRGA